MCLLVEMIVGVCTNVFCHGSVMKDSSSFYFCIRAFSSCLSYCWARCFLFQEFPEGAELNTAVPLAPQPDGFSSRKKTVR